MSADMPLGIGPGAAALSPSCLASEQTYSGARTFLRTPRVATASAGDFAIVGVPLDVAASNRPGARFGPDAIGSASAQLAEIKSYPGGFNPLAHVNRHIPGAAKLTVVMNWPAGGVPAGRQRFPWEQRDHANLGYL